MRYMRCVQVRIPLFNKGLDEREDPKLWTVQRGRVDVVLYEGWRVGVDHPAYKRFNEAIDCLVTCGSVPSRAVTYVTGHRLPRDR